MSLLKGRTESLTFVGRKIIDVGRGAGKKGSGGFISNSPNREGWGGSD